MTSFEELEPEFRNMKANPVPSKASEPKRTSPKKTFNDVNYLEDSETGRKYRVEYLLNDDIESADGKRKLARIRGRVALSINDLPTDMQKLTKKRDGDDVRFEHVYERKLKKVQKLTDDTKRVWYQPMFKRRHTEMTEGGKKNYVTWYGKLGSYWDPAVAAVAAEMAIQRLDQGKSREEVETVENDILSAARDCALSKIVARRR